MVAPQFKSFEHAGAAEDFRLKPVRAAAAGDQLPDQLFDRAVTEARRNHARTVKNRQQKMIDAADFCDGIAEANRDTRTKNGRHRVPFRRDEELPGMKIKFAALRGVRRSG